MACGCREVTTILKCASCGRIQTISHAKTEDPLAEAKKQNRQCKTCYSSEFIIT